MGFYEGPQEILDGTHYHDLTAVGITYISVPGVGYRPVHLYSLLIVGQPPGSRSLEV